MADVHDQPTRSNRSLSPAPNKKAATTIVTVAAAPTWQHHALPGFSKEKI
jgi:hypothetical protein